MTSTDLPYNRKRATDERVAADIAPDETIAAVHHQLADLYEAVISRLLPANDVASDAA